MSKNVIVLQKVKIGKYDFKFNPICSFNNIERFDIYEGSVFFYDKRDNNVGVLSLDLIKKYKFKAYYKFKDNISYSLVLPDFKKE